MRKHLILTTILALCACNNGGGHGGAVNISANKPGNISGGQFSENPQKPSEPEKPSNDNHTLTMKSTPWGYDVVIGVDGDNKEQLIFVQAGAFEKGQIKDGILYSESFIKEDAYYTPLCEDSTGCDVYYKKGETYLVPVFDKNNEFDGGYTNEYCQQDDGCKYHIDKGFAMTIFCREATGCKIPGTDFTAKKFENGKYIETITDKYINPGTLSEEDMQITHTIARGTQDLNVALRFSDFGYWNQKIEYADSKYDNAANVTFLAGDIQKETDMRMLSSLDKVSEAQTYSGKSYVAISSAYPLNDNVNSSDGFLASGTAHLVFDPTNDKYNPTETITLGFADSGWYNVFMNADGTNVRFWGNIQEDTRFRIAENPDKANEIEVRYYSDDTTNPATEVVGTANFGGVKMQDGNYRDIRFSFGAVKDK